MKRLIIIGDSNIGISKALSFAMSNLKEEFEILKVDKLPNKEELLAGDVVVYDNYMPKINLSKLPEFELKQVDVRGFEKTGHKRPYKYHR